MYTIKLFGLSLKIILMVVSVLPFITSCATQAPDTTSLSYKNEYFDLLRVNKKYAMENKKLKYQNKKLFFNRYVDVPEEFNMDPNYAASYLKDVDAYKKSQITRMNKLLARASEKNNIEGLMIFKRNGKLVFSFDNQSLFLESGFVLTDQAKLFFDFVKEQMIKDSEIEVEILNYIDDSHRFENLYFKDVYDLASQSNNQIRRYLISNVEIASYRFSTRINNLEQDHAGQTELILYFDSNFYNSPLSSIK